MNRSFVVALLAIANLKCVSDHSIATQLVAAAQPAHLPHVVSCWEKAFEKAGFQGEYVATVDFVIEQKNSQFRDAKVLSVEPIGQADASSADVLSTCLEVALNRSSLPIDADHNGPGFVTSRNLAVRGYRFVFIDASRRDRERASANQAHVLLGPRADRCQGLYAHDPPRDASTLFAEIAQGEARVSRLAEENRDLYARELQKTYDTQLELRERLHLDASQPDLPRANRKRVLQALDEVNKAARKTASAIQCELPPRPR